MALSAVMMISGLFPLFRFHLSRLFRARPAAVIACATSAVLALLAAAALLHEMSEASAGNKALDLISADSRRSVVVSSQPVEAAQSVPSLPWFQSAQVVEWFGNAASDNKLPLEEVAYVLEDGANRPYLRYRVTMKVTASYPAIRQFTSDVTSTMTHVDLDSINCARSDIVIAPLTCELAFSAFFRKDKGG